MRNFPPSRQRLDRSSFGETVPWGHRCTALILAAVLLGWTPFSGGLRANPSGGAVRAGQATINGGAGRLTVKQTSPTAIIHWQDFSVGLGETTQFIQPNASSAALNRVVGGNPSAIYGTLQANGQVYLINPNGVLVGASGVINTAGFLASTLDVTDEAFEARGDLTFRGDSSASVVNLGTIGASEGDVILIARTVENHGTIQAPRGTVALAAGNEVLVKASGEERVFVRPEGSSGSSVSQAGLIEAATVELKAAGGNEYALAIKHSGVTRATGVVKRGGRIMLSAGGKSRIVNSGTVSARRSDGSGGRIQVEAAEIEMTATATVDASAAPEGAGAGGHVLLGGGLRGEDVSIRNAERLIIDDGSAIRADGAGSGAGGSVVLWADRRTDFGGELTARGGNAGGAGGFAEISGKEVLNFRGRVDTGGGTLLLDPTNITVQSTAGDLDNTWGVGQINTLLLSNDLILAADVNITWNGDAQLVYTNTLERSLTLQAGGNIVFNSGASIAPGAGAAALNIILNSDRDASGGGNIQLTNTTITSNGGAITLGGGLNPLTTAAIGMGTGSPQQKSGIFLSGGALNSGAGAISLLGEGVGGTSAAYGIYVLGGAKIGTATGTGNIKLNGSGGIATAAGTSGNHGILITGANSAISASAGAISIIGKGGQSADGSNYGIFMTAAAQVVSTGTASVTLDGTGGVGAKRVIAPTYTRSEGNNFGVYLTSANTLVTGVLGDISIIGQGGSGLVNSADGIGGLNRGIYMLTGAKVTSTGTGVNAGKVTLHGTGGSETQKVAVGDSLTGQGMGLYLNNVGTGVESIDGDISITGIGLPGSANFGLFFYNGTTIRATGRADMHLIGDGNGYTDFSLYAGAIASSLISNTGDIIIEANTWGSDSATSGFISVDTLLPGAPKGRLIIRPRTAGTTVGIGSGVGTLSLTAPRLGFIQDGFSEIIIGSETAGNLTVNAATFTDNLRLITGGTLALNGALNTGANQLALIVGGPTTQAAALTAGSLRLGGNGNFTLLNAGNNIVTLSKDGTGSLAYMDADSVAIGTVDGINGLVGSSVDLRANTNITAANTSITTTGGTIILNSDRDATGGGNIQLTGTTITSNGGEIILSGGGGDANALRSTGVAVGSGIGSPAEKAGIYLSASTLISDAGAITLRGEGIAGTDNAYGIHAVAGSMIGSATGSGAIALHGSGGAGTINNVGIHLTGTNTAVRSADGAILISGRGMGSGGNNHGILLSGGAVVESTGIGAIAATVVLNGTGATGASSNYGTYLTGANTAVRSVTGNVAIMGTGGDAGGSNYGIVLTQGGVVESTGTGAGAATLNLTGTGGNGSGGNHGFYLRQDAASRIKSIDGAITLTGLGQGSSGNGIHFAGNFQVETSASAPITLTATGAGTSADLVAITTVNSLGGATATGNITLNADTIDWGASLMTLQSKGTLLIQPRTPTTTIGLGDSAAGKLNLTVAELAGIKDGFAEIIIGNATAGNTTVNAATFTDNLRLITGGTLAINGALNTGANRLALIIGGDTTQTAALTAGSLRLGGNGDFTLLNAGNNTVTLSKDGTGSVAYMDADSVAIGTVDGINGLVGSRVEVRANTNITATNTSITTPGGTIILNADRDGVGRGNIQLSATTIVSNEGNIVLGGGTDPMTNAAVSFSTGSTANNRGIYLSNSTIRSGSGDISMRGKGNDGDSGSRGIELSGSIVESSTGAVSMHGEGGAFAGGQQAGVSLVTSTVASDSGSIDLTAFGGSGGNSMALLLWNGAEVLSRDNGTITLTGTGSGSGVDLYSGRSVGGTAVSKIGNHVDAAEAGNIILNINTTNWASENTSFQSDGTLTIQPRTVGTTVGIGGGSGTLNLSLDRLNALQDGFSEIIIGSTDAGNITANAATFTDPLRLLTGGNLVINGALNTGANQLALIVGGTTTQAAALTAGSLRLGGNGNFTLLNAANNIATLAKDGTGSVSLRHGSSLTVGSVDGVNGVSGSTIDLRTDAGNLTLSQAVIGSATGNAVVLSTPGAFINNVGAAAVSTPNGRWLIYTAAPAGNTYDGLLSGNHALYNRTYTGNPPTGITESGNRYLFANQPTLTFTSTSDSKTYGDDFTVAIADNFTVSGFVDAATYGNVFTQDTLATITSGTAVASSAGAATTASVAGSPYSVLLDITGVTATTGYTLSKTETGQLTVGKKALTVTANNQSKTYGDTFTFAGTEFSSTGLITGDAVTSATIGSAGAINTATVAGSSYGITISGATGSGLENYNISYVDGSLTVNKRDITVTALGGTSTYGDSPGNPGLSATNLATFDTVATLTGLSNSFGINSMTGAGNHVLTVDGTLGNGNYNITSRLNGNWSVAQKALTVTANNQRKVYGQGFTFAGTEFRSTGLINGDKVNRVSLASSGATKTASVAGGPYLVTVGNATGTGLGNYAITYAPGLLTVTPAPLSIVANNASRALNRPNPTFTATISGFVLGEKLGSLRGDLQFSTLAILGSPLGSYDIIPFGVASTNYEITFTPGTLTVGSPVENPLMTRTEHADAEKLMKDDFEKDGDETFKVIYEFRSYPGSITTLSSGEVP